MLPPFVPPSVRATAETLPLITEFVVSPVERSFSATFATAPAEETVTTPEPAPAYSSIVPDMARNHTPVVAQPVVVDPVVAEPIVQEPEPPAPPVATFTPPPIESDAALPAISEFASPRVTPVEPMPAISEFASHRVTPVEPIPAAEPSYEVPPADPAAEWVDEERNAFDWQSVAQLASTVDDTQRANDEWTTTDWEHTGESDADHVSTVLVQLARRVRSGELRLEAIRGASVESTLASVLAALLADAGNDAGRVAR